MSQIWCQNCIHCLEGNNPRYPSYHWYCNLEGYDEVWNKSTDNNETGRYLSQVMKQYEDKFYIDDGYLYFCAEIEYDLPYRVDDSDDSRPCIVFLRGALYGSDYDGFVPKA